MADGVGWMRTVVLEMFNPTLYTYRGALYVWASHHAAVFRIFGNQCEDSVSH